MDKPFLDFMARVGGTELVITNDYNSLDDVVFGLEYLRMRVVEY
jgi:hypothetical protein